MKRSSLVSALLLLAVTAAPPAFALWGKSTTRTESGNAEMNLGDYKGLKHAIGCKEFSNAAGWHGDWEIGPNLTTLLESALYDSGRFVIGEREKLRDVLAEQDLAAGGRAAKSKVAKTGLIRPARYIASGDVTEVSHDQSGGGAGISFKGIRLGGGKNEAQVTVIVKLIDTTTGEIVAKERVVGKAGGTRLNVGLDVGGVSTDLGGFKKTPIGQAAQDCINKAAAIIAKKMEEFPFEGSVVKVSGGKVYINRGAEFGVEPGQELVMKTEGETLTDPDTGAILGKEEGEVIGKLKVVKADAKLSTCEILDGEKNPKPGTLVSPP